MATSLVLALVQAAAAAPAARHHHLLPGKSALTTLQTAENASTTCAASRAADNVAGNIATHSPYWENPDAGPGRIIKYKVEGDKEMLLCTNAKVGSTAVTNWLWSTLTEYGRACTAAGGDSMICYQQCHRDNMERLGTLPDGVDEQWLPGPMDVPWIQMAYAENACWEGKAQFLGAYPEDEQAAILANAAIKRFAVVREPLTRAVSGYVDKIACHLDPPYGEQLPGVVTYGCARDELFVLNELLKAAYPHGDQPHFNTAHLVNASHPLFGSLLYEGAPCCLGFTDFVSLMQLAHDNGHQLQTNEHLLPQNHKCRFDEIEYDTIFELEKFKYPAHIAELKTYVQGHDDGLGIPKEHSVDQDKIRQERILATMPAEIETLRGVLATDLDLIADCLGEPWPAVPTVLWDKAHAP